MVLSDFCYARRKGHPLISYTLSILLKKWRVHLSTKGNSCFTTPRYTFFADLDFLIIFICYFRVFLDGPRKVFPMMIEDASFKFQLYYTGSDAYVCIYCYKSLLVCL